MLHASSFQGSSSGSERTEAAHRRDPRPLKNLAARRHSFVPSLENLEDRTVPSGGYVFQTIDPPQAAQVSIPTLINSSGEIVGGYADANFVLHGYLLRGGQYTTLDDPNAGTGPLQGTVALGINASGKITGTYLDANSVFHGFLLSGGQYTTIDDPNAGTGAGQGTQATVSNASGNIVGVYMDANSVQHGFLLSGGQYTTLDDPAGVLGSGATGLNDHGQVTGAYVDANGLQHGFLLSGGQYTTLDDPAGVLGNQADSINNSGSVVGAYTDSGGVIHGYLATRAQGNSTMSIQGAAGGRGSMTTLDAFRSVDSATPDRLPPVQVMLGSPLSTPAVSGNADRLPTQAVGSRIDPGSIDVRWSMAHESSLPSRTALEGLPMDWLFDELAPDFAHHW
jgi:hypothetical protein